jgi:hypothetical protein
MFCLSLLVWVPLCCCAKPKKTIVIVSQVMQHCPYTSFIVIIIITTTTTSSLFMISCRPRLLKPTHTQDTNNYAAAAPATRHPAHAPNFQCKRHHHQITTRCPLSFTTSNRHTLPANAKWPRLTALQLPAPADLAVTSKFQKLIQQAWYLWAIG